ncbi:Piwi domain-containing protein [Neobacillus sp. WH10]|uniref:Piwi domain-containing protein n=1 Tax=Neobacillus sp. WH10 TaxID=3047873 RepID=UPI0024C1D7E0|nr:Piwi domain-containing protein [Neobacillus sp. WH10]WHY78381.1 Piwi domain-containing protein [Neobacillus sp. WH10]
MGHYYLTEWLSSTNTEEIPLHIYKVPIKEIHNRHAEGGMIAYNLRKNNDFKTLVFFDQYIASFEELESWGEQAYLSYTHKIIDPSRSIDRTLMERLIKREIEQRSDKDFILDKGIFRYKKEKPLQTREMKIFPAIHLDVTVEDTGSIVIGFEYKHLFEFNRFIISDLASVQPGTKLVDSTNKKAYEYIFKEVAAYKAGDISPYLGESVISYYQRKGQFFKLNGIDENSPVVHVESKDGKVFPYLPHLLKLRCSFDQIPNHLKNVVNKAIKLSAHEKMGNLLKAVGQLVSFIDRLTFPKKNVFAENLGYQVKYLPKPSLLFGENVITNNINSGLSKGGVYRGNVAKVSFFVDPSLQGNPNFRIQIKDFIDILSRQSDQLGVKLDISTKPIELRGQLHPKLFSSQELNYELKSLGKHFEGTIIVLGTEQSTANAYLPIKKEFGGRQDLVTQFVNFSPKLLDLSKSHYQIMNILLGIYVKSGIQPWILGESLYSDCFIGLDVSHENGKHTSGVIQVIGKDGRLIKQKSQVTSERGEIISWDSLKDILLDSIHAYQEVYGKQPKHLTIHRDGFGREDIEQAQSLLDSMNIQIDFVEVLKNNNRRMAVYEGNKWITQQGLCYLSKKERKGYLCSTNPREFVGMAQPIKIIQRTETLSFEQIMSDIYKLSFMHIHSMQKTRLPISTHYADLSSTFYNRGLLHPRSQHEHALPFV